MENPFFIHWKLSSSNGIYQHNNVTSTVGRIFYNFTGNDFVLSNGSNLISADELIISGGDSQIVKIEDESTLSSIENLHFTSPIYLLNGHDVYFTSKSNIIFDRNVNTTGTIDMYFKS